MSGILRLESLTKGNTLKQGDKTPLKYRLFDADGENLNIAGKSAKVRLVYPDYLTIGYEKDGLTVAQDDTVTFTIDRVIPSRIYHVEIIVDDKFVFPSRADESKFTVDKSSFGTEANIIEIVGKDVLIQEVKSQVDAELQPLVTSLESAEQAEIQRATAESSRVSAEEQRKIDHENRSAELAGKADKKQEDWITPTLLNGFTGNVRYRKTQFGHLEIFGTITSINPISTTAFDVFSLPSGYRPARDVRFEAPEGTFYTFRNARIVYANYEKMIRIYAGQGGSRWDINVSIPMN